MFCGFLFVKKQFNKKEIKIRNLITYLKKHHFNDLMGNIVLGKRKQQMQQIQWSVIKVDVF